MSMGQVTKTRPHHQFIPYVYPLPQLPPPLWIPPWPPSPPIQRKDGTNSHLGTIYGGPTKMPTMDRKQKIPKNQRHLRRGETKHSKTRLNIKEATMGPKQRGEIALYGRHSENNVRRFKVREKALQPPAVHLTTPEQNKTAPSAGRPPEHKIRNRTNPVTTDTS